MSGVYKNIYFGTTPVAKVFKGSELVWRKLDYNDLTVDELVERIDDAIKLANSLLDENRVKEEMRGRLALQVWAAGVSNKPDNGKEKLIKLLEDFEAAIEEARID